MGRPGDSDFDDLLTDIERLSEDELVDFRRDIGGALVDQYFDGDCSALPVEVARIVARCERITAEMDELMAEWKTEGGAPTADERDQMAAVIEALQAKIAAMWAALE